MGSLDISTDDFVAISNLMGHYQFLVDAGDEEGWASLFTEDGAFFGLPGMDPVEGREALKQIPKLAAQMGGKGRHLTGSFSVRYGDSRDEAFAQYYVLFLNWEDESKLTLFADVRTHLVRVGDGWKIKSNTMKAL